jgi:hypothetical protein
MCNAEPKKFTLTLHVLSDSLVFHFNNGEYLLKNQLFFLIKDKVR